MTVISKYLTNSATNEYMEHRNMGTLTVAIDWKDLTSDPSYCLENNLKYLNPRLKASQRQDNKLDKGNNYLMKNGYNKHVYGFIGDNKFIMVSSEPKKFNSFLSDFKITWHQSQWENQKEVVEVFVEIFGCDNAYAMFFKGRIIRSDFWIDAEISYDRARKITYRSSVSVSDQRRGNRRSYYLGTKGPKQAVFYEKLIDDRSTLDIKRKAQNSITSVTRFEARYFAPKVPINSYSEYEKSADLGVFDHIKTCIFKKQKVLKVATMKGLGLVKINRFLDLVDKEGLHFARKAFNQNRNFYRTIHPILVDVGIELDLSIKWRRKIQSKIVGDFDIRKYFYELGVGNE